MNMKVVYLTVLSASFLPRALAVSRSVLKENVDADFAFFCIDDQAANLLERLRLPRCHVYRDTDINSPKLPELRASRTISEYCWTLKSVALCHLLQTVGDAEWIAYLDSDMLAFGDLNVALAEVGSADFMLAPHRFAQEFRSFGPTVGYFNGGYVAFRVGPVGKAAASRWRELCIESCPAVPTSDSYADQKHLERLLTEFPTGVESPNVGLNTAPWNIGGYAITSEAGRVLVSGSPLLLYHFQGFRPLSRTWVDLYFGDHRLATKVRDLIYMPYLNALTSAYREITEIGPIENLGIAPLPNDVRAWLSYAKRLASGRANLRHHRLWD
jgi:hypothetical protein